MTIVKVKDVVHLIVEAKKYGGKMIILINKKESNFNHKRKKPEMIKCRILGILNRKQQLYVLITPINRTKANKMSIGGGTRVLRIEHGNNIKTFILDSEKTWQRTFSK